MRRLRWRWALAFLQVAGAVAALLYAPTQYRSGRHAIGDDTGLVIWRATYPPKVMRIAYAMSFPALAVTVPLRFAPQWAVPRLSIYRGEPLILLDTEDFAFFAAVGLLWYWIGAKVDRLLRRGQCKQRPRAASAALAAAGLLLAAGVGALAAKYATLTDADKPWKEVGPFGLVWSAMLICYFGWRLFDLYKQASVKSEVGA